MHSKSLLSLALVGACANAFSAPTSSQAELVRTGGVLGETLRYDLSGGAAFDVYWLILSLTQGPTPVGLIDPGDPRILSVGLDLFLINTALTPIGLLDGDGEATIVLPLGNDASLACFNIYGQFLSADISFGIEVQEMSNQTAVVLGLEGESCNAATQNLVARQGHSISMLPGGSALVVGGDEPDEFDVLTAVDSMERYDPSKMAFADGGTLQHARSTHTATVLDDGRVLLLGGYDETETVRNTGEIYDPVTGLTTAIAPMSRARTQHSATLMADGRVFVAGGGALFDLDDVLASLATATDETEVYDPDTNTWTPGPDLDFPNIGHAASLLPSGEVLISGGVDIVALVFGVPVPAFSANCYLLNTAGTAFTSADDLPIARTYHAQATLADGDALVVGGANGDFVLEQFNALDTCYKYDRGTDTWSAVDSLNNARAYPNILLDGATAYVIGGLADVDVATGSGTPEQAIESTDTSAASWTDLGSMLLPREVARSVLVDGGERILTVGTGDNGVSTVDRTAELFVP